MTDNDWVAGAKGSKVILHIGGGTTGAMEALEPVLLQQWGHCPRSKLM